MTFSGGVSVPADYGKPEPLFDPPGRCAARGCEAGDRKNLCWHDWRISNGEIDALATRPRGCLNSAQNRDGIPYA